MPNVTIRRLPEPVHRELQRRAEAGGQSLQQYLLAELERLAKTPSLRDVLSRIEGHEGGRIGFAVAVEDLEAERRTE